MAPRVPRRWVRTPVPVVHVLRVRRRLHGHVRGRLSKRVCGDRRSHRRDRRQRLHLVVLFAALLVGTEPRLNVCLDHSCNGIQPSYDV